MNIKGILLGVFFILVMSLPLGMAASQCPYLSANVGWINNFNNRICFTNIVNTTSFNSKSPTFLGFSNIPVGYLYVNLSDITLRGSPIWIYTNYYYLQGFNNANQLVGNVSAYPYEEGLLVNLRTINKQKYSNLVIYFNQSNIVNTFYYANYSQAVANTKITNLSDNNYVTYVDRFFKIYAYLLPSFNELPCYPVYYRSNSTCPFTFNPLQNFSIIQIGTQKGLNISLNYSSYSGTNKYTITQTNTGSNSLFNVTSYGNFGFNLNLYNKTTLQPFYAVIQNATPNCNAFCDRLFIATSTVGALSNFTIYNSTSIENSRSFIFCPTCNKNFATLSITNNTQTVFVIAPLYSSSYTNSLIQANPVPTNFILINSSCYTIGKWCYRYENLYNVSWQYRYEINYLTAGNVLNPCTGQTGTTNPVIITDNGICGYVNGNDLGNSAVPYLKLTLAYSNLMGNNCDNVNFEGFNSLNDTYLGFINFSTIECLPHLSATYIIYQYTNTSVLYNQFYAYEGSITNQTAGNGWASGHWLIKTFSPFTISNNTFSCPNDYCELDTYNITDLQPEIMTGNSLSVSSSNYGGGSTSTTLNVCSQGRNDCNADAAMPDGTFLIGAAYDYEPSQYLTTSTQFLLALTYQNVVMTHSLFGASTGGFSFVANQTFSQVKGHNQQDAAPYFGTFTSNTPNMGAFLYNLYTTNVTLSGWREIPYQNNTTNSSNNNPCAGIGNYTSNCANANSSSVIKSLTNNSVYGNQSGYIKNHNSTVMVGTQEVPQYYLIAIDLFVVIAICLMLASNNEFVSIMALIGLGLGSVLDLIGSVSIGLASSGTSFGLGIIGILVAIIYIGYNAEKLF